MFGIQSFSSFLHDPDLKSTSATYSIFIFGLPHWLDAPLSNFPITLPPPDSPPPPHATFLFLSSTQQACVGDSALGYMVVMYSLKLDKYFKV